MEIELAISSTEVCCVSAVRYGGKDISIFKRLNPEVSDYIVTEEGEVILNTLEAVIKEKTNEWWKI